LPEKFLKAKKKNFNAVLLFTWPMKLLKADNMSVRWIYGASASQLLCYSQGMPLLRVGIRLRSDGR
jgi:hypothetical protein